MAIRPDEFLKKYGFDREDDERDHSLRHNALEHARHLRRPRAGTPRNPGVPATSAECSTPAEGSNLQS